jgi:hypothetical protein
MEVISEVVMAFVAIVLGVGLPFLLIILTGLFFIWLGKVFKYVDEAYTARKHWKADTRQALDAERKKAPGWGDAG